MPTSPTSRVPEAPRSSVARFLAAALCSVAGLGCPSAQVRPEPAACPYEAREAMFEILKIDTSKGRRAVVDINQPGGQSQLGTYQEGPVVGRVVGYDWADPALPDGTLLYGRLWTELDDRTVMVRYSEAKLPDGRTYPVCIVLGGRDGRVDVLPGSRAGAAVLSREQPASVVQRWP